MGRIVQENRGSTQRQEDFPGNQGSGKVSPRRSWVSKAKEG